MLNTSIHIIWFLTPDNDAHLLLFRFYLSYATNVWRVYWTICQFANLPPSLIEINQHSGENTKVRYSEVGVLSSLHSPSPRPLHSSAIDLLPNQWKVTLAVAQLCHQPPATWLKPLCGAPLEAKKHSSSDYCLNKQNIKHENVNLNTF